MAIPKYQHQRWIEAAIISGKFENGDKFLYLTELIKFMMSALSPLSVLWTTSLLMLHCHQQGRDLCFSCSKSKLVEFSNVETFPIQKGQSQEVLSDSVEATLSISRQARYNQTFYYKDQADSMGDDTYIFHQTYVLNNTSIKYQIWNTSQLYLYDRFKEDTTFIWTGDWSRKRNRLSLHQARLLKYWRSTKFPNGQTGRPS